MKMKRYIRVGMIGFWVATSVAGCSIKLTAPDGQENNRFGAAVAAGSFWSGDEYNIGVVALGATGDDDRGEDAGAVYLYESKAETVNACENPPAMGMDLYAVADFTWDVPVRKVTAPDGEAGDAFGAAVDLRDTNLVVGAPGDDDLAGDAGAAYRFRRGCDGLWQYEEKLLAPDGASGDDFGGSVSGGWADGTAVAAQYHAANNLSLSGAVYLFSNQTVKKFSAPDAAAGDHFGSSLFYNLAMFIGANGDDDRGESSGSVYIFEPDRRDLRIWSLVQKIVPEDAEVGDRFGSSLAHYSGVLVVGAPGDDDEGVDAGAVYVYSGGLWTGAWTFVQKLTSMNARDGEAFGTAVSVANTAQGVGILVGAPHYDSYGAVYAFLPNSDTGKWAPLGAAVQEDNAPSDRFGAHLAAANIVTYSKNFLAVVTATGDGDYGSFSGSATVYSNLPIDPDYEIVIQPAQ